MTGLLSTPSAFGIWASPSARTCSPENTWPGNFRDLNAMVTRMSTLADGGRITADLVQEEIRRARKAPRAGQATSPSLVAESKPSSRSDGDVASPVDFTSLLGTDYAARFDDFDLAQLAHVIRVCRASDSMADAARKLFAVSLKAKKSSNNTDRLSKYLAKFGLKFRSL